MRVTDIKTVDGLRLAVDYGDGLVTVEADRVPRTVDALVRGGDQALQLLQRAAAHSRPVEDAVSGVCVPAPGKIICIGLNYRRHALETGSVVPTTPVVFGKFANTLVASGDVVRLPSTAHQYDYEA